MEGKMKSKFLSVTAIILSCVLMIILGGCNLITTDKDRFILDEDNDLTMIDIEKTGPDIVVPEKVGDNVIRRIYLSSSYFSKIDSIDISNVYELEYFRLKLFEEERCSNLKKLDFSKNNKLKYVGINGTKALEEIIFNKNCKSVSLYNTSVKELDLKPMKKLEYFDYSNGPLENIDLSNNTNLDQVWIKNANIKTVDIKKLKKLRNIIFYGVHLEELDISNNPNLRVLRTYNTNLKVLDVSNNPKLKRIEVDEGTEIVGETNAEIKYWTKEDIERLEENRKDN
jgi:cell surface protein (putative penicillin-binding protein)